MYTTRKQFLKQAGFALAGSLLPYSKLFAGTSKTFVADTRHPSDCSIDLTNAMFGDSKIRHDDAADIYTYYKNIDSNRDVLYKDDVGGCTTATANDCYYTNRHDTDETALRYKASYPISSSEIEDGHNYDSQPLPVVILFHAGGYMECSKYNDSMMLQLQYTLVRRGYIVICVEYRTGRRQDGSFGPEGQSAQQQLAIYRGQQDGRGAIRSIMKRNTNFSNSTEDYHNGKFKINPDQVFIGGASAGAALALGVAFYQDQDMTNLAFPSDVNSDLTIREALGGINADNYFGEANGGYFPVIRGVLSCWGGILIPKTSDSDEAGFFAGDALDNPPVISFVGAADEVIKFPDDNNQDKYFSILNKFKKVSFCLKQDGIGTYEIKTQGITDPIWIKECSNLNIYNMLKPDKLNRYAELYVDCDQAHGLDVNSDYGLDGSPTEDDIKKYIAKRAAICFQKIMRHGIDVGLSTHPAFDNTNTTYFQGCENKRKCGESNNNTCGAESCIIE